MPQGQLDWGGDSEANPLPFNSASFLESDVDESEFTCLLSTKGDDGAFIDWNGPSLLSPLTAAGDVFRLRVCDPAHGKLSIG
ncbi:hypothetical protein GCM10020218_050420 [Dactylosporangium vinaceum]